VRSDTLQVTLCALRHHACRVAQLRPAPASAAQQAMLGRAGGAACWAARGPRCWAPTPRKSRACAPRSHPTCCGLLDPVCPSSLRSPQRTYTVCRLQQAHCPLLQNYLSTSWMPMVTGQGVPRIVRLSRIYVMKCASPSRLAPARRCHASPSACSSAPLAHAPPAHRCGCWCTPAVQQAPHATPRPTCYLQLPRLASGLQHIGKASLQGPTGSHTCSTRKTRSHRLLKPGNGDVACSDCSSACVQ
jgi:hypothetical protein